MPASATPPVLGSKASRGSVSGLSTKRQPLAHAGAVQAGHEYGLAGVAQRLAYATHLQGSRSGVAPRVHVAGRRHRYGRNLGELYANGVGTKRLQ